jgi:hypothetical protein
MALRPVTVDGVRWTVWDVVPERDRPIDGSLLKADLRAGWLCLECGSEKRRIVPSPEGWETWPDEELAAAVRGAESIPFHRDFLPPLLM